METITAKDAPEMLSGRIHALLSDKSRVLLGIDGMAASGKTTLAAALAKVLPDCFVVHMDDFFLNQSQRQGGYFAQMTAWADVERARDEVLVPLSEGKGAVYRPFVFHPAARFLEPVAIPESARIIIVEGAYSMHPLLAPFYDLTAALTLSEELQQARIRERNGEAMLPRFLAEWIPMENTHLQKHGVLSACDYRIICG